MGKKVKEKQQVPSEKKMETAFDVRSEADKLLKEAAGFKKKAYRRFGWAIFFGIITLLLAIGLAVISLPINGAPIYAIDGVVLASLWAVVALLSFIIVLIVASAKKKVHDCIGSLIKRGDLQGRTPLYIKMM